MKKCTTLVTAALVCDSVTTCRSYAIAPCAGKAAGASCVQTDTAGKPDAASGSGCTMTPGASRDALSFGAPLGLLLALKLVFRRKRPVPRVRS